MKVSPAKQEFPKTRTQSTEVVAGSGVVLGMNRFVPMPNASVRQT